jgi:hypothetical protein
LEFMVVAPNRLGLLQAVSICRAVAGVKRPATERVKELDGLHCS